MRIIRLEGNPNQLRAADMDHDGRDELIVINTRQARLEVYRWMAPKDRDSSDQHIDPDRPNELPMAPEFSRDEIPLDDLPRDVIAHDLDGDGASELIVLSSPPNRISIYKRDDEHRWQKRESYDLLPGEYAGTDRLMLLRDQGASHQILVSCNEGIQMLSLGQANRASWMQPRERINRMKWWLGDLDGDGQLDVVEWTRQPRQTVRWYQASGDRLLPAQVLFDQDAAAVETVLTGDGRLEVVLLGGLQEGLVRRYRLGEDEVNPVGSMQSLPMSGANRAVWTGMMLEDEAALVTVDAAQPRLLVYMHTASGWQLRDEGYPIIAKVQAIAAPQAERGTLLLWAKDATDLHISRWEEGRFSYPQLMEQSADVADRAVLALGSAGRTTWWAQRVGKDLDLYTWSLNDEQPQVTRFENVGERADRIAWLGGARMLVLDKHARHPKLVVHTDSGETQVSEPSHLRQVKLEDFALYGQGESQRLGMMSDGVLQWLDEQLQPYDQIMLPEGQALASYVPMGESTTAWALASGGQFIHKLAEDESGLPRVVQSYRIHFGTSAVHDPVLGLMLMDSDRIIRVSEGPPRSLSLLTSLDGRVGRRSGVREATIHRVLTADVTGDGREEVIISDDRRHHLTVLTLAEEQMEPIIAWQVFDDIAYPYGSGSQQQPTTEPRAVIAWDADGDGQRDLAMLCHDRLIFYLAAQESDDETH